MTAGRQTIPVRVYDAEKHIVLAAPLSGLEPENISVTISGNEVRIVGEERGPGQHRRRVIVGEWTFGPYYREILLPQAVDGSLTNATYGNGVLVLSMPKAKPGGPAPAAAFRLYTIEATRGERVGHAGMQVRPAAMPAHRRKHRGAKGGDEMAPPR